MPSCRESLSALLLVFAGFAAEARGQVFVPGDLNDDGAFDIVDSTVQRRALEMLLPGITQPCVALHGDVNADGSFDATDASVVRFALVGLGPGISQTCANPDSDDDGFEPADGDCDDTNPLVNPAAFDFVGNGLDDDCEGTIDTSRAACDGGLSSSPSSAQSYALALDLCQTALESPPANERTWGVISSALTLAAGDGTPSSLSRSVRSSFGPNNGTRFGLGLAVLSTGRAAAPGQVNPAHLAFQPGAAIGSTSTPPADWLAVNGGAPPVAPGCPATSSGAQDSTMLHLRIRVPSNARSFRVAAKHFSSEFPEFVCSAYGDYFVVLLDSAFAGAPANPADGNLAVVDGIGVGANLVTGGSGLFQDCVNGPVGCAPGSVAGSYSGCLGTNGLADTGMELSNPPGYGDVPGFCGTSNRVGGATAWLAVRGNVVPGETIDLRIGVWDTEDALYDSIVLLDDFRWSPTEIQPGAIAD